MMLASVWSLGFHSASNGKKNVKTNILPCRISMKLKLNENIILISKLLEFLGFFFFLRVLKNHVR